MKERAPFDPADPTDAMSEMFRREVTNIALKAYGVTLSRELTPQQQLECFLAGALTGVVGVCLASVKTEGADAIMDYIKECLPVARLIAESIVDDDGKPAINRHDATPSSGSEG